jgi:hypothetical protein
MQPSVAAAAPVDYQKLLLDRINEERKAIGMEELILNDRLSEVAAKHAQDMIDHEFFGHYSPITGTLAARIREAGLKAVKVGENLAGHSHPSLAHDMLMSSPSHRGNMLDPQFDSVGIAVIKGGTYGYMIVEVFADFIQDLPIIEEEVVPSDEPDTPVEPPVDGSEETPPVEEKPPVEEEIPPVVEEEIPPPDEEEVIPPVEEEPAVEEETPPPVEEEEPPVEEEIPPAPEPIVEEEIPPVGDEEEISVDEEEELLWVYFLSLSFLALLGAGLHQWLQRPKRFRYK